MVLGRISGQQLTKEQREPALEHGEGIDVNAVVSYNVRAIRQRRGWTQQSVGERLAVLTKHLLPQASISAMERAFDGERRRRFDAHELYLLSVVFDVPIVYFFLPPRGSGHKEIFDTHRPVSELYAALLGRGSQLAVLDERLADMPEQVDEVLAQLFGAVGAENNWHDHFRTWRKKRVAKLAKTYDALDDVAEFLADFAMQIKSLGPHDYLQGKAQREGERPLHGFDDEED
jgi:transcriptional regulator with XRE-family HTH domain